MYKEEPSPVAGFRGYRVRTFRQSRANLAERTQQGRVVHFVPWKGVAGVFLSAQEFPADAAALEAAWQAAGAPPVRLPKSGEAVLFGRVLPVRTLPFAGYDDLVEEADGLCLACKGRPDPEDVAERVEAYRRATLLARAHALLEGWGDRLTRSASIPAWPTGPRPSSRRPSRTRSPTSPTSTTPPPFGAPSPLSSPIGFPVPSSTTCERVCYTNGTENAPCHSQSLKHR